ncbi:MAG: hypothetical protein OXH31_00425 [Gammaproteobacteria bacterium]|nr:hypothetical protein [Gammaproteobacteria bacterium]
MHGVISPRYLLSVLGNIYLAVFCIGVLLLVFDMHSRDENHHIREVLDSKPVNILQLFIGRLFGVFTVIGLPLAFVLMLAVIYGYISEVFAIPFGEPIELWSVASFLILDVLPNFIFFGSLVLLLAWIIRPRFIAFLLVVFCLLGLQWINVRLPLEMSSPLQTVTGNVIFPSELAPTFWNLEIVLNRVALILMGLGFLSWLSFLYSRNTGLDYTLRIFGLCIFVGGILLILGMLGVQYLEHRQVAGWKRFHDEHFEPTSFPDIHHLGGTIDIYPGRTITLDLRLEVSVSKEYLGEYVLFSLNPAYRISEIGVSGERINKAEFKHGLLKIPRRYFANDTVELQLKAKGRPKPQFAYLDSTDQVSKIIGPEARQLRYLGTENYIFHPKFVALMPGVKWYPSAGTATNEDSWGRRHKDFFTVDLHVSVPRGWLVAGPATRELEIENSRSVFSFNTHNPLPQFALVASRFESASLNVEEIKFELLYSRVHRRNFDALNLPDYQPLRPMIESYIEKVRLSGVDYPYSVYSLVEVPASLRTFGGGNELSSVLGMPGILMMPETSLPTMHLDSLHRNRDYRLSVRLEWTDHDWLVSKLRALRTYFGIDQYAGNHLVHFYQSVLSDQTNATGPRAAVLNQILEQVVQLSFSDREISFDFDIGLDREVLDLIHIDPMQIANILRSIKKQNDRKYIEIDRIEQQLDWSNARDRKMKSESVMEAVESLSLAEYESSYRSTAEKRAFRLRTLAISRVLVDVWGTDVMNSIVAELLERFRGQNFTYDDFIALTQSKDVNIAQQLTDMIHTSSLPGFIVSNAAQRRIQSDEVNVPNFETTFTLYNGESVAGYCLVVLMYSSGMNHLDDYGNMTPILVDKNQTLEIVVHSKPPMLDVVIQPYLSRNRGLLQLNIPQLQDLSDEERQFRGVPEIVTIREIETDRSVSDPYIVVDDLDTGFSVSASASRFIFRPLKILAQRVSGASTVEMVRGLPAFQFNPRFEPDDIWERKTDTTAFGKYWKTLAINRGGRGETFAKFATRLPTQGFWQLEYFLPAGNLSRVRRYAGYTRTDVVGESKGIAHLDVHVDETEIAESLDTSKLEPGWHVIGSYEIDDPEVEVWISNPNKYHIVFADAVRWKPLTSN